MVEKRFVLLLALIFVLASLSLVSAAVTLNVPVTDGNYTIITFNCTQADGDVVNASNASIYYNASGGPTTTQLGSAIANETENDLDFTQSISIESLDDGTTYNFTCVIDNITDQTWAVGKTNITIDNTAPNVSTIITPINNANSSGIIVLNATVNDLTIGMSSVFFNLTTTAGIQQAFLQAIQVGSSGSYNVSLTTSSYSDGKYNLTVYANDTLNNLNKTESYKITIDNNPPTISMSRYDPSSSTTAIAISLTTGDAGSGINGSCSVNRAGASISSDGRLITESGLVCDNTYTYIVTCSDYIGNSSSKSNSFSTDTCPGSGITGAAGGGPGAGLKTYSISEDQFTAGYTKQVKSAERIKVTIENQKHTINIDKVTASGATITVSSTPQTATLSVGETKKFDVTGDNLYDLQVTLNKIVNSKADITVKSISEEIIAEEEEVPTVTEPTPTEVLPELGPTYTWIIVVVIIIIIAIIAWIIIKKRKQSQPIKK